MPLLHPNELEFYIETNALVPAERALHIGANLLVFLRQPEILGAEVEIRLAHLGQGSLVARIMAVLRDPATAGAAALVGAAFAGVSVLKEGEGDFPEAVARACIESNATRCGFRVGDQEFVVERDQMPAITRVEDEVAKGAPASLPPAGHIFLINNGKYLKDGDKFLIERLPDERQSSRYGQSSYGVGPFGDSPEQGTQIGDDSASPVFDSNERDFLTTENGEIITTEGGDPIEVEDSTSSPSVTAMNNRSSTIELDGHFFTGVSNYVFHALDGRRFEVLFRGENVGPPTATPVHIVATKIDAAPREGLTESVLLLDRWERRDGTSRQDFEYLDDSLDPEAERLEQTFGTLGENEFVAIGHIRRTSGTAYFDARNDREYLIENVEAVRKIRTGEVAAVLEQRGEPLEDSPPRVWVVKYQTADWNLND